MKIFCQTKSLALLLVFPAILLIQARPKFNPAPYYAPEKSIYIQGINLVYLEQGAGTPVLLIHGYCGNAYNWSDVFEELSKNFRVIAPDLPGFGKSGCPEKKTKPTMIWYADFLAEFLSQIGVEKAVVVGNSMGGSIATWLAIRHPERVDKLVLVDSAGLKGGPMDLMKGFAEITAAKMIIPLIHLIFPVNEKSLANVPPSERKRVELAEQRYGSDLRDCSSKVMKWSAVSIGADYTEQELQKIQTPTLIIWGSNDDLLNVKYAEKFQQKIPGSQLAIIEGGVHTPMQWKPEEFVKVLKGFIEKD
jgi:pimeloyl-ACP methyl ester carboxylesterase